MLNIATILGGSIGDVFSKVVGTFKLAPEKAAELEMAKISNAAELAKIQADADAKLQDAVSNEIQSAAEIIKAEAGSQSWLPRNVRPLLLFFWGMAITFNAMVPIVGQFWHSGLQQVTLDPWVYKLTAIGFTGYVTARTWEKIKDADN